MNAVGILGSYISKGVYTVSGPFHPFGGAVDIVVVEQQDGSFKSSPWYVRFGKFQGVLKTKEKVVNIVVNGVEANFQMYMDHKGEAYFLREVDVEGESGLYPSSSSDEAEGKLLRDLDGRRILGSESCNYDARSSIDGIEKSRGKGEMVTKTTSRRQILGFAWGRKSIKEDHHEDAPVARVDSLQRAEIAADLLEVRWSTNLRTQKLEKSDSSKFSSIVSSAGKDEEKLEGDDEKSHVTSTVEGDMGNCLDKDCDNTCRKQITSGSPLESKSLELSIEVTREISNLNTKDQVVETPHIGEKAFDRTYKVKSAPRDINQNAKDAVHAMGTISESADSMSQISLLKNRDSYYGENFIGHNLSDETNIVSQVFNISEDKSESDAVQSFVFYETSKSSMLIMDDSRVLTHNVSHMANGGSGIVDVLTEGLHVTAEVNPEDTDSSMIAEDFDIANYSQQVDHCNSSDYEGNTMDQEKPLTCEASHTQIVYTEEMPGSVKELKSDSIGSSFSSDFQDDKGVDGSVTSKSQNSLNSIGNRVITKESHIMPSTNSDDEQFLFSDIDVPKTDLNGNIESVRQHYNDKEGYPLVYPISIDEEDGFVNRSYATSSSPDSHEIFHQGNPSPITIPQSHAISNKEVERLAASLPNMPAVIDIPITCEINHPLSHSVDSNSKSLKWMEFCNDNANSKPGGGGEEKMAEEQSTSEESWVSEELKSTLPNSRAGNRAWISSGSPAEANADPAGNWTLWPFSFKRSSSRKGTQSAVDDYTDFDIKKASDRNIGMDGEGSIFKYKAEKKMVRSISPTSEQLASLNLKEGGNKIIFTFYTTVLGEQQVDARIYLWKWNTRVVISDVDGTITKSDVLGQFMPFVGMDWSQTGVTNLFSAIKENGYQLLFLSARSISQAYHTRQFLFNLKQDGKALPEGPVVISPDGLFPSLYREVIRRAPHEFKIACLERIRELFPPDCNPFYAGFGNRDTDEFSYLKVGIPKGKIFIINPKGEVVVNRRVDTKSYTSLHTLVNGMFPPMTSSEQEDFNSWNYWKLPPPSVGFLAKFIGRDY